MNKLIINIKLMESPPPTLEELLKYDLSLTLIGVILSQNQHSIKQR